MLRVFLKGIWLRRGSLRRLLTAAWLVSVLVSPISAAAVSSPGALLSACGRWGGYLMVGLIGSVVAWFDIGWFVGQRNPFRGPLGTLFRPQSPRRTENPVPPLESVE